MEEKKKGGFITKLATFIVDKRNLFFLLYIFAFIFCLFSMGWVKVENDVTTYLPEDTETRQGLVAMNENFVSFANLGFFNYHSRCCYFLYQYRSVPLSLYIPEMFQYYLFA